MLYIQLKTGPELKNMPWNCVHFFKKFPNLHESTVRNFKKAYKEKLTQESKKLNPQPITRIVTQPKGGH